MGLTEPLEAFPPFGVTITFAVPRHMWSAINHVLIFATLNSAVARGAPGLYN